MASPDECQRPAKRAKPAQQVSDDRSMHATRLQKHHIALPRVISPAAVFSCRVAGQVLQEGDTQRLQTFLASGAQVYECSTDIEAAEAVDTGKEGVLLPRKAQDLTATATPGPQHRHEIHSLTLLHSPSASGSSAWLGSVDCYGHAILRRRRHPPSEPMQIVSQADQQSPLEAAESQVYVLVPEERVFEAGWAGLAVDELPNTGGEVAAATAAQFARQLCFYQGGRCVRTLRTLQPPTAVTMLPTGAAPGPTAGLLACAEEHMVSLWDVRAGEKGGLVQRLLVSPGGSPLFSLAWCEGRGGLLGAAGAERALTMLDPRKWRVAHKWSGATKYSVHHISFSRLAPSWCFVSGSDNECVLGRWDGSSAISRGNANSQSGGHGRAVGPAAFIQQRQGDEVEERPKGVCLSFRGDSCWMGVTLASSADPTPGSPDRLIAASQAGSLFFLETKLEA